MSDQSLYREDKTLFRVPLSDINHFQVVEVQSELYNETRTDTTTKVYTSLLFFYGFYLSLGAQLYVEFSSFKHTF